MKMRFHLRLQSRSSPPSARSDPIPSECPAAFPPVAFGYLHRPHRRRKVAARRHPIPDLVEIVFQIPLKLRNRLLVDPCRSLVRLDPLDTPPRPPVWKYRTALPCLNQLLPFLVGSLLKLNDSAPSLQSHYRTFIATTGRSAPVLRIGTLTLVGLPLGLLPLHRSDRFPRSAQKPGSSSRHLHAGRRSGQ